MSLRELCRRHGVTAHSAVVVQARHGKWVEKRETYRSRASATYIPHHADRAAAREAELRDHAIEAIDEAITKFSADLKATDRKVIDGVWVEEPRIRVTPREIALLIDRTSRGVSRPPPTIQTISWKVSARVLSPRPNPTDPRCLRMYRARTPGLLPHANVDEGTQGGRLTGPEAPRVGMGW